MSCPTCCRTRACRWPDLDRCGEVRARVDPQLPRTGVGIDGRAVGRHAGGSGRRDPRGGVRCRIDPLHTVQIADPEGVEREHDPAVVGHGDPCLGHEGPGADVEGDGLVARQRSERRRWTTNAGGGPPEERHPEHEDDRGGADRHEGDGDSRHRRGTARRTARLGVARTRVSANTDSRTRSGREPVASSSSHATIRRSKLRSSVMPVVRSQRQPTGEHPPRASPAWPGSRSGAST